MGAWQRTLADYSATEANGDLNFLRGDPTDPPYPRFTVIGAKSADDATDVNGVLLGRRNVQDQDWYIFLLGGVVDRRVEDIRLALLKDAPGKPLWIVNHEDRAALGTYQQHKRTTWQTLNPARPEPPPALLGFPGEGDVFELEAAQDTVTVTETTSGARWTVVVPELKSAAASTRPQNP